MTTVVSGVKISELSDATLPLAGTELVALVQGGVTKSAPATAFGGGLARWTLTAAQAVALGVTNNLATDITNANRLLVTPAGDAEITGLAGGVDGQILIVQNMSAAFSITLTSEAAGSLAANRWVNNGDTFIPPRGAAAFMRDTTVNRWIKL